MTKQARPVDIEAQLRSYASVLNEAIEGAAASNDSASKEVASMTVRSVDLKDELQSVRTSRARLSFLAASSAAVIVIIAGLTLIPRTVPVDVAGTQGDPLEEPPVGAEDEATGEFDETSADEVAGDDESDPSVTAPGAVNAAEEEGAVVLTIDIYSGLPNPTVELGEDDLSRLDEILVRLPVAETAASPIEGLLGFRGFVVEPHRYDDQTYRLDVTEAVVLWPPDAPPDDTSSAIVLQDDDQEVLRLLREIAVRNHPDLSEGLVLD